MLNLLELVSIMVRPLYLSAWLAAPMGLRLVS